MTAKPTKETHLWYACNTCGAPRKHARMTRKRADGETKAGAPACIMTPNCKGKTTREVTEEEALALLKVFR